MEISKSNILETIQKMVMAGKQLPQKDRIRFSKDPAAEEQLVLTQTAQLWWDLFKSQHIGVERWELATQKALMVSGVNKLDIATVNPGLMSYSLELVEKEHLAEVQARAQEEKKDRSFITPANFPEMGKLVAWHMRHHKKPLLNLPEPEDVRNRLAQSGRNYPEQYISKNMLQLRVYFCYCDHADRDGAENPLKLSLDDKGYIRIAIVP